MSGDVVLTHPNLPGVTEVFRASAAPFWRASGWVDATPAPEPEPEAAPAPAGRRRRVTEES